MFIYLSFFPEEDESDNRYASYSSAASQSCSSTSTSKKIDKENQRQQLIKDRDYDKKRRKRRQKCIHQRRRKTCGLEPTIFENDLNSTDNGRSVLSTNNASHVSGAGNKDKDDVRELGIWSLLGMAMIAESILGSLHTSDISTNIPTGSSTSLQSAAPHTFSILSTSNNSISAIPTVHTSDSAVHTLHTVFPRVYSPQYLWYTFYPYLYPLLHSPLLSHTEGLRYILNMSKSHTNSFN